MSQADLPIAGDAEATLPWLIEEIKREMTGDRKRVFEERGKKIAEGHAKQREQAIADARYGWDSSPISLARLAAELWPLIKNEDWSLVGWQGFIGGWPGRLWNMPNAVSLVGEYTPRRLRVLMMVVVSNGFNLGAVIGGLVSACPVYRRFLPLTKSMLRRMDAL